MKFNFLIIPAIIVAVAYFGARYTTAGLGSWYLKLKKPSWTPNGKTIGEIWTTLYLLTGFAVMWYWNVPKFSGLHYAVGVLLLINAGLNLYWSKLFFVDHDLRLAYKEMIVMNVLAIAAAILMMFSSIMAGVLLLPYIVWVGVATKLTKEIISLNK
ncbi:MAG: TspO/MBR family protein [Candidatus Doudnabacteria bacterium]